MNSGHLEERYPQKFRHFDHRNDERRYKRDRNVTAKVKSFHFCRARLEPLPEEVGVIPVFALGRMQEMLVILDEAFRKNASPEFQFFCSGLGMDLVNHFHEISRNTNRFALTGKFSKALGPAPYLENSNLVTSLHEEFSWSVAA